MALSFKTDSHNARGEVARRVKDAIYQSFRDRSGLSAFSMATHDLDDLDDSPEDHWPWIAYKSLRASMLAEKLVPPGEVFTVESQPVLQRHAFVQPFSRTESSKTEARSFRPALRIKVTHVKDVEERYREMRFGASMFADHFPGRYEKVLAALATGIGG